MPSPHPAGIAARLPVEAPLTRATLSPHSLPARSPGTEVSLPGAVQARAPYPGLGFGWSGAGASTQQEGISGSRFELPPPCPTEAGASKIPRTDLGTDHLQGVSQALRSPNSLRRWAGSEGVQDVCWLSCGVGRRPGGQSTH